MGIREHKRTKVQWTVFIRSAVAFLIKEDSARYTQASIKRKLDELGKGVAKSLLNKVVNGGIATPAYLRRMGEGLEIILMEEAGVRYDFATQEFLVNRPDVWEPSFIAEAVELPDRRPFTFHASGRRSLAEKTLFMAEARREVVFLGLRMRQFTNYFFGKRDEEFVDHIKILLARGVDVKCLLLDPDSNHAHLYFRDLAEVLPETVNDEEVIKDNLRRLLKVGAEMQALGTPGKFRVFTYRHLPTAHYLIVDGNEPDGKIHVSHYLYGQASAKVPVLEVWRKDNAALYDLYLSAGNLIMKGATERTAE